MTFAYGYTPDILFLDRLTSLLNLKSEEEIMEILSTIHAEGTAILLVIHDTKAVAGEKRVSFMKDGKMEK